MSGIVGSYHINQDSVDPSTIHKMLGTLCHRGPDGADIWHEGPMGLGHCMLFTTTESLTEQLPLADKNLVITADARIDNRAELLLALGWRQKVLEANPIEPISDSQIILASYEKWGERCVTKLVGAFAFAIWDKAHQKLFCARDHMGIKPFYYFYRPGSFLAFASEIKALLCLPQVPQQLNEVRIGDYLALTINDKITTTYQDILRLAPAHSILVSQSLSPQLTTQSYWELDPSKEILLDSDEAYCAEFRRIFTEAVRCRLRSAFPLGSQLSGGLDSSSVTCVAKDLLSSLGTDTLHTLSVIFDDVSECDERSFINPVLEKGGLIPHYIYGDRSSPLSDIDTILPYEDEAYLGPNHFYPWIANRMAKELDLRVVLDGFDGDTTVSHGTARLTELAQLGQWQTLIQEARAIAQQHQVSLYRMIQKFGFPNLHTLLKHGKGIAFVKAVRLIHQTFGTSRKQLIVDYGLSPLWKQLKCLIKLRRNTDHSISPLVNATFIEETNFEQRLSALAFPNDPPKTLRQDHWQKLTHWILPYTLEQVDRYAAFFSIEARHPFMDKRLIEFCLALPADQKLAQGLGRIILRRSLDGILPHKNQWRVGKTDLSPNFDHGLLKRDRHIVDEVMSTKIGLLEKYIDVDVVQSAYNRIISSTERPENLDCMMVWQTISLALWLESKNFSA